MSAGTESGGWHAEQSAGIQSPASTSVNFLSEWESSQIAKVRRAREEYLRRDEERNRLRESSRLDRERSRLQASSSSIPHHDDNNEQPPPLPTEEGIPHDDGEDGAGPLSADDLELKRQVENEVNEEIAAEKDAHEKKIQEIEAQTAQEKEQDIAAELETLRTQERVEVRKIAREENERKLQTLESQRAANERDFDDAKQQMVTVSKLQSENAKLKQDNDALIARYEKQLKQKDDSIADLQTQLKTIDAMLAQEHQREMLSAQARFEEEKQQLIELHASDRARWERLLREEEHKTTLVKDELTVQGKQNESMRDVYNDEKAKIQKENDTLRKHIETLELKMATERARMVADNDEREAAWQGRYDALKQQHETDKLQWEVLSKEERGVLQRQADEKDKAQSQLSTFLEGQLEASRKQIDALRQMSKDNETDWTIRETEYKEQIRKLKVDFEVVKNDKRQTEDIMFKKDKEYSMAVEQLKAIHAKELKAEKDKSETQKKMYDKQWEAREHEFEAEKINAAAELRAQLMVTQDELETNKRKIIRLNAVVGEKDKELELAKKVKYLRSHIVEEPNKTKPLPSSPSPKPVSNPTPPSES